MTSHLKVESVTKIFKLLKIFTYLNRSDLTPLNGFILECSVQKPYYTILPEDKCASPGDTVKVQCEVYFGFSRCIEPFFKDILFYGNNKKYINFNEDSFSNAVYYTNKS